MAMRVLLRPAFRPRVSLGGASACAAKAAADATGTTGATSAGGPEQQDAKTGTSKGSAASRAREAEPTSVAAVELNKVQRFMIGGCGALLAVGGTGGLGALAWTHYPMLVTGGFCAVAGGGGAALLATAAQGKMPQMKGKSKKGGKAKQLLDFKLLNNDVHFKADMDALKEVQSSRRWPAEVQKALDEADKTAEEAAKKAAADKAKELLLEVKEAASGGATGDDLRRKFRPRVFVFDFKPSQIPSPKSPLELLRTSVTFIIATASEHDEALLRLTSPGGAVGTYGLAASQLQRLRDAGIRLTVCVDTVAASGGYMMACVADHVVAAPFAMIGSIGVIAGAPNLSRFLERNDVEFHQVTAGKYKRTINVLTPNTEEGLTKFQDDIEVIHCAFKDHIQRARPSLDVERVATGEVWLGSAARDLGLVDALGTSDEAIRGKVREGFDAVALGAAKPKKEGIAKLLEGLGGGASASLSALASAAQSAWRRASLQGPPAPRVEAPQLRGGDS